MRTDNKNAVTLALASVALVSSCARFSPTGFWTTCRRNLIVAADSDQGPWGGGRWVHWVAEGTDGFDPESALKFAGKHGWVCEAPVEVKSQQMTEWVSCSGGRPMFPQFFARGITSEREFPRHIASDSTITRCDTSWIRVEPGTDDSSPAYGYIQVSENGTRMALYHPLGRGVTHNFALSGAPLSANVRRI